MPSIPRQFNLSNYPNPVRDVTTIQYGLAWDCRVLITIHDLQGRAIATPLLENKKAGFYSLKINTSNFINGVYYYKITAISETKYFSKTNKIIIHH